MADSGKRQQNGTKKPGRTRSSTGKKNASSQKKGGSAVKRTNSQQDTGFMRAEVIIICSFAVAVLLFLSNFRLCGAVGDVLRSIQLGIFGLVGYLAPILLFVGTCFHLSNQGNIHAALKLAAVFACVITLCGLLQLLFGTVPEGAAWSQFYTQSSANGAGGGWLGGVVSSLLIKGVGRAGAYLVFLVLFIISMVYITERSFVSVVKKGGNKAYQYAREDMDRRREIHAQKVQERRQLREEQKIRGVNLDATRLTVPQEEYDKYEDEDLEALSDSMERHNRTYPEPVITGLDVAEEEWEGSGQSEYAGQIESEIIHVKRDSRTLEEMDLSLSGFPLKGEQRAETEEKVLTAKEEAPWEETEDQAYAFEESLEQEIPGRNEVHFQPEEDCQQPDREYSQKPDQEEEFVQEESGYDSFFVPEEPKRVVTSSGKIIETDTELLQKKIEKKREEARAEQGDIPTAYQAQEKEEIKKEYIFPPTSLLKKGAKNTGLFSENEYKATAMKLQQTLHNFGVGVTVTNISCGPSVTRYELLPEQGVKVSKIVGLTDDIKLSLAAADIRIEAPIPGKSAVGIEVPNKENHLVHLRELLESAAFAGHKSRLAFAVGKDIGGQVVVTDIAKMPHLLIAGSTGSGKSVCINTLIMSIIFKSGPEDVKLIMVDPKVVELSVYNGIPHLLIPVVTDPKKASGALNWAVAEMEDRYRKFAECNVRDLKGYNERIGKLEGVKEEERPQKLPQIVIIIDELADLMMVAPGEVEDSICRLAQLARAAGIHLVIATQRPSVNVITGLIKANVPSRIAFAVSSGVDSRTIIDMNGAEKLLGKGDMLFYPAGFPKPQRVQGAFVSDEEVGKVVEFLTEQGMTAQYSPEVEKRVSSPVPEAGGSASSRDEYFVQAARFIIEKDKASIGMLQRMFKIGFNRAARIMDQLAEAQVVGEEEGTKPRKVLMSPEQFEEFLEQGR